MGKQARDTSRLILSPLEDGYNAVVAVDSEPVSRLDDCSAVADTDHSGHLVFPSHNGSVTEGPADICHASGDHVERRRPTGSRHSGDQDITFFEFGDLLQLQADMGRAFNYTR